MVPLDLTKKVGSELLPRKEKQYDTVEKKKERKGERKENDRVAKPCQPVGVNFFWPVLIFGKSTRKTVLLCP